MHALLSKLYLAENTGSPKRLKLTTYLHHVRTGKLSVLINNVTFGAEKTCSLPLVHVLTFKSKMIAKSVITS